MGRRRKHAPKRGSLAYLPRGRASSPTGRVKYWPEFSGDSPTLLGFAGYKAGMGYVYTIGDHRGSPTFGQEVFDPVTVVESPPAIVCGIRAYTQTENGLKTLTEAWMRKPPEDLNRVLTLPEDFDTGAGLMKIEKALNQVSELRGILCTQPRLASVPKKKPDVMEVKVDGGTTRDRFGYLKSILGKEVRASDIFKEGQFVDVIAVTKGKGVQGPVKRWGVKTLHHKSRKTVRGVGTLGPWRPGYVMYTVPRAGQMGFHQRTEYNKRILKIGSDGEGATPKGGFTRYGVVKSDYIMLRGSVPGPMKRLIKIRYPARPPSMVPEKTPSITYTSFAA